MNVSNWKRLALSGAALLLIVVVWLKRWSIIRWLTNVLQEDTTNTTALTETITATEISYNHVAPPSSNITERVAMLPDNTLEAPSTTFEELLANRQILGWILGIAAVVAMLLSGYGFRWEQEQFWEVPSNGLIFMVIGAVLLGVSIWLLQPRPDIFSVTRSALHAFQIRWLYIGGGAVLLLIMAESNSNFLLKEFRISQHLQMLFLFGGAGLIAYGFGGFKGFSLHGIFSRSYILLWLIILIGLILRTWQIAESVHIMIDELHFYDGIVHLWLDPNYPILHNLDGIATFTHVFSYFEQLTTALFGTNFAGVRLTSAIFGVLTIPAVYFLGRSIGDHKTGLLAAAVLAILPPHIHFSRLAMNNIADPLFGTLAIAFLLRALRYGNQRDYIWAGIVLGFTCYFYEGGRLLFLGLSVIWLIIVLIMYRPWSQRRGLIILGICAALIFMPYYYAVFGVEGTLTPRLSSEGRAGYLLRDLRELPADEVLLKHYEDALRPAIFHTIYSPDSSQFYYGGYTPILQWFVVPFFLLGLFFALFRFRSAGLLLWIWVIFAVVGISFVVTPDWTVRFCVLFPVMAVLVAIGIRYPLDMLWPKTLPERGLTAIPALIVIGFSLPLLTHYFGDHLKFYNQQVRMNMRDFYDAFDRTIQMPNISRLIYITDEDVFIPVIDSMRIFQNIEMTYEIWRASDSFEELLQDLPQDEGYVFAIDPNDTATRNAVEAVFPVTAAPWSSYESVPIDRQYALYVFQPET